MTEFRIEFVITRRLGVETDFSEVGFGSSGAWADLESCAHAVSSAIQSGQWETEPGMPAPAEVAR